SARLPFLRLQVGSSSAPRKFGILVVLLLFDPSFRALVPIGNAGRDRPASTLMRGAEPILRLQHPLREAKPCPNRRRHLNFAGRLPLLFSSARLLTSILPLPANNDLADNEPTD